jgi:hypothetical protein
MVVAVGPALSLVTNVSHMMLQLIQSQSALVAQAHQVVVEMLLTVDFLK